MICEQCKYAEWKRTKNGRLHPSGQGRCAWKKTFQIAGSVISHSLDRVLKDNKITISGGWIWRKRSEEHPKSRPVFERKDTE